MLQLLDLARENAALKYELDRLRQEAKELRLLLGIDGSAQCDFDASAIFNSADLTKRKKAVGRVETRQDTPREESDDSRASDPTRVAALLAELNPSTDLASLVERVCRNDLSWIVVPVVALAAWEQRDPSGWAKVLTWLETKGVTIVRI